MAVDDEVRGMTYESYDADRDPSGAIGHALADKNYWRIKDKIDPPANSIKERVYERKLDYRRN